MKQFTAEYHKRGQYGTSVCMADTIEELIENLVTKGYDFYVGEKERISLWSQTVQKKYYSTRITIRRGELEMTEYTSL